MHKTLSHTLLTLLLLCLSAPLMADPASGTIGRFNVTTDLFLPQFDSKTDVDDVHSIAGVATVLSDPRFAPVRYHAVAGAYGIQEGAYVPSPALFAAAFGDHWSDAHQQRDAALEKVTGLAAETLRRGGSIWVAEAGQSDFTADWVARLEALGLPTDRVHVFQHSDWNESVTSAEKLARVQATTTYHKIGDGNGPGNGTPNFKTDAGTLWPVATAMERTGPYWQTAREIADRYNGVDNRYLNEAIAAGGLDFSDVVETCWIFGFESLPDAGAFFAEFGN